MADYPRTVPGDKISAELRSVIDSLTTKLLSGHHPSHSLLRRQYAGATVREVEITGAGFFAHFEVPKDLPVVQPARMIGGCVTMEIDGSADAAGSLLYVSDGRLEFLEVYMYGDKPWTEHTVVESFGRVVPLPCDARAP